MKIASTTMKEIMSAEIITSAHTKQARLTESSRRNAISLMLSMIAPHALTLSDN